MGYYVNPPDMTKEEFLKKYGMVVSTPYVKNFDFGSDSAPVCLVDNGMFTAAAIAWCKGEVEAFTLPDDNRRKQWFIVSHEKLAPYIPARRLREQEGERQ